MSIRRAALLAVIGIFLAYTALSATRAVITVNGDTIYSDEFDYLLTGHIDSFRKTSNSALNEATLQKLKKELAGDLVEDQLYLQEARRRGISARTFAGEEEIEDLIMRDPVFYDGGRFNQARYIKFTLESSAEAKRMRDRAEAIIIADRSRQIIVPKVELAIKEEISSGDLDVFDEYMNRAELMNAAYIPVDPAQLANNMDVREDDVRGYYERNKSLFSRPPVRRYATLYFDPEDYKGMVSVTSEAVRDYYAQHLQEFLSKKKVKAEYAVFRIKEYLDRVIEPGVNLEKYYGENPDKFIEPAQAHVYLISIKKPADPSKLDEIRAKIRQGFLFSDLAKEYSDDPSGAAGGDLGLIKKGILKEPFNGVAFSLLPGSVSQMIETENGYYFVSVTQRTEERLKPFAEVRDEIEALLLRDDVRPLAMADAKRFRIEAVKLGFEEAAKRMGKTVYLTDYFSEGDVLPSIGKDSAFTSVTANLASGEVSPVIEYNEGFAVSELSDEAPQRFLGFDEAAADIERKLVKEDSLIFTERAARHTLDLFNEKLPLKEVQKRSPVRVDMTDVSSSLEAPQDLGSVVRKGEGFSFTVLVDEHPSYISPFQEVSREAAAGYALETASGLAEKEIESLRLSGALTMEGVKYTGSFARSDYMIGTEYMKPFIEQCFNMRVGETGVVKSFGKYYLVRVLNRGIDTSGRESENAAIMSNVLREKREKHLQEWLSGEKERAEVVVNL